MADKEAQFRLKIDADAKPTAGAADELERLRAGIEKSENVVRTYRASMRALRGSSDEVKEAKVQLKTRIEAERDAISRNNLAILKLGTSYDALSKKTKAAKGQTDDVRKAISTAGGPVAELSGKFDTLKTILGGANTGLAVTTLATAAVVAATVAFTAAIIGGTIALARFVVESANALRAMGLQREAATGSAQNAQNFGHQLDALSDKLATPKDKLNALAVSTSRALVGTRVGGQGIVDTFEAVASASEAMGDDAGRALMGIIERSKRMGRVGINPFELQGTGVAFQDVAGALAKNMKVGVAQAQQALLAGVVPVDDAAKAIKDAVNTRFGEVNAKKMLDLNVIAQKFHENLAGLTKGVNLEPFLRSLSSIAALFSDTTSTGHSLQVFITAFGNLVGSVFQAAMPLAIRLTKEAINWGLRFGIAMLDVAAQVVAFGQSTTGIFLIKAALVSVGVIAGALGVVLLATAAAVGAVVVAVGAVFATVGAVLFGMYKVLTGQVDWSSVGTAIVDGIKAGLSAGWEALKKTVVSLAGSLASGFETALGIRSPSTVFRAYGRALPQGAVLGVQQETPRLEAAVTTMAEAAAPPAGASARAQGAAGTATGAAGGGGASSARPAQTIVFHIHGSGSPEKTAELMRSGSVLDLITHAIEVANRAVGIPTQSPVPA